MKNNLELWSAVEKTDPNHTKKANVKGSGEFETINTISIYKDNAQTKVDDDLAKKVETDTLTKSLSKLGFSADIFLGRYDDVRYVAEVTKEFTQKPTLSEDKFSGYKDWTDAQIQSVKKNYKLTEEQLIKLNK